MNGLGSLFHGYSDAWSRVSGRWENTHTHITFGRSQFCSSGLKPVTPNSSSQSVAMTEWDLECVERWGRVMYKIQRIFLDRRMWGLLGNFLKEFKGINLTSSQSFSTNKIQRIVSLRRFWSQLGNSLREFKAIK